MQFSGTPTTSGVHDAELQRLLLERKATQAAHAVHQAQLLAAQAKAEYDQHIAMEHVAERVAHAQTKRKLAEAEATLLSLQPTTAKKPKFASSATRPLTAWVTVTRSSKTGEAVDITRELANSERKAMEGLRHPCEINHCHRTFRNRKQLSNHLRTHRTKNKYAYFCFACLLQPQ